jgi:hypothetical protein
MKTLHKFFNKVVVPWVQLVWEKHYSNGKIPNHTLKGSFWWRGNLRLLDKFKGIASVLVHKGDTCSLWHDLWGGSTRRQSLPQLFSFARKRQITVARARDTEELAHLFTLPLSEEAFQQLLVLVGDLNALLDITANDVWSYIWGSPIYSSVKAYKQLIGSKQVHPCYLWLWKASAQKKHKVFFWLLLKDRLSTRNILRRKHRVLPSYNCVLCNHQVEETVDHLFLLCPFALECWNLIHIFIPLGAPCDVLYSFKDQLQVNFFMDIIILMCWTIWMARNDLILRGQQPTLLLAAPCFKFEFALVVLRAKVSMKQSMVTWIESVM